jgi:hypothetical protein
MTELTFIPNPESIINQCRCISEEVFLSGNPRSDQLEHVVVNADRFVLLLYAVDWECSTKGDTQAIEQAREVLTFAHWIQEQAVNAMKSHRIDRDLIWSKYAEAVDSLLSLLSKIDVGLSASLESAL